jgi:predicted Ser/Thr protein kinase
MKCPKCGIDNPDNAKFCPECGERLAASSSKSFTGQATFMPQAAKPTVSPATDHGDHSFTDQATMDKIKPRTDPAATQESGERYKLIEKLGEGGMGVVFKAMDTKLGRLVALKRLVAREQVDREGIERFLQEGKAIASLNHRNIVLIYDLGKDDQGYFIAMEYIDGIPLGHYIRKQGKLAVVETVALVQGIGSGLFYAHKRGIVHRDIKPANIMLDRERVPKILDFGLAKIGRVSQMSKSGFGMGTPDYVAPEQKMDAKNVDYRSDIYSLGATMYEMLTGDIPRTIRSDRLPPEIMPVVFKCLEEKPEDRYFSVGELLAELDRTGKEPVRQKVSSEEIAEGACPQCSQVNKLDAKFCKKCGSGLFVQCPACQKETRAGSEFCEGCGVNIAKHKQGLDHLAKGTEHFDKRQYGRAIKDLEARSASCAASRNNGNSRERLYANQVCRNRKF